MLETKLPNFKSKLKHYIDKSQPPSQTSGGRRANDDFRPTSSKFQECRGPQTVKQNKHLSFFSVLLKPTRPLGTNSGRVVQGRHSECRVSRVLPVELDHLHDESSGRIRLQASGCISKHMPQGCGLRLAHHPVRLGADDVRQGNPIKNAGLRDPSSEFQSDRGRHCRRCGHERHGRRCSHERRGRRNEQKRTCRQRCERLCRQSPECESGKAAECNR